MRTTNTIKLIPVMFFLIVSIVSAQDTENFNLDFEKYKQGDQLSKGWFRWGNYELSIDSIERYSGNYAGKIQSNEDNPFGSIAYRIPANYNGTSISLEGYMKISEVKNGFAGLLLRVDGNGRSLSFDNMQSQNISGTRDWQKYTVTVQYPEDAEYIYVAGLLTGKGEAWFDHFKVTIDGSDIQTLAEAEKPVYKAKLDTEFDNGSNIQIPELTDELVSNLDLLGKVWGFLKYHHPAIASGNFNMDYELFRILPEYLKVTTRDERDKILLNWIEKYGTVEKCEKCTDTTQEAILKPDHSWIEQSDLSEIVIEKLNYIYQNRNQGRQYYISLVPNIGNPEFKNENAYANMSYPDDGFRLLSLYRYWNMIHYFFPNKHLIDKGWNNVMKEYIPVFLNAKDELEYEIASLMIIGDITDTHANLWGGNNIIEEYRGNYFAPVHLRFIENELVVNDYYNPELKEEAALEIGDIISKINGRNIKEIVDSLQPYYPASNQAARLREIAADMLRSTDDHVEIEDISDGQKREKSLTFYPRGDLNIYRWYRRNDEKCYKMLDGNIGYITLASIKADDIIEIKEAFIDAKGIIIDIRNYPSTFVPFSLGSYFVSTSTPFVKFTNGNIDNPGEFNFTPAIEIPPNDNPFKGKVVVLVNELTQSQAEYTAMAFKAGKNTTVIGSTTAGADGNISAIMLPGGLRTMISGIGVYFPDGTDTQRVGIVPDVVVEPTIEGIKKGKDELLEKAIEIINLE